MNNEKEFYKLPKGLLKANGFTSLKDGSYVVLPLSAIRVYVYMLSRNTYFVKEKKGEHYETQDTIAQSVGLERKAVGRVLKLFIQHGIISGHKTKADGSNHLVWRYTSVKEGFPLWVDRDGKRLSIDFYSGKEKDMQASTIPKITGADKPKPNVPRGTGKVYIPPLGSPDDDDDLPEWGR